MGNKRLTLIAVFLTVLFTGGTIAVDALTWPISPDVTDYRRITGNFGEFRGRFHRGVDITPSPCFGTPVLSTVGGPGVKIQYNPMWENTGYNVKIFGDYGFYWYMHLAEHSVPTEWIGQVRNAPVEGAEIAHSSNTGTRDCHLHLQTWAGKYDTPTISLNPLAMWDIPDETACRFEGVRLRLEDNTYRTLSEGRTYRLSGAGEFLVKAHDRTNPDALGARPT